MKAPFLYQYLHGKMLEHSSDRKISSWDYRWLASQILRLNKNNSMIVLGEMESLGLVKFDKSSEVIRIL